MTIQSEINRINQGVQDVYTVLNDKKAVMPQTRNLANLVTAGETLPDFTLMGNELRKAYAYTHTEDIGGMFNIYNPNTNSMLETPFEITGNMFLGNYKAILNGEIYSITSSSNGYIQLEKYTEGNNWKAFNERSGYVLLLNDNNELYYGRTVVDLQGTTLTNPILTTYPNLINNGKLYKVGDNKLYLLDNTTEWNYFGSYSSGIRNNKFVAVTYNSDYTKFTDIEEIFDIQFDLNKVAIDDSGSYYLGYSSNKFYYFNSYGTKQYWEVNSPFNSEVVALWGGTWTGWKCLCKDNTLYDLSIGSTSIRYNIVLDNVKGYVRTVSNSGLCYNDDYVYFLGNSNLTKKIENPFKDYTISSKYSLQQYPGDTRGLALLVEYPDSYIKTESLYCSKYDKSKAYKTLNNLIPNETVSSSTPTTIIVNDKTYERDLDKDSTFTFVPDELKNHQFTDQELCQAYLNAGAKPAGSNPVSNDSEEQE